METKLFNTVIRDLATSEPEDENAISVYEPDWTVVAIIDDVLKEADELIEQREQVEQEQEAFIREAIGDNSAGQDVSIADIPDFSSLVDELQNTNLCSHCGMNEVDEPQGVCDSCYEAEQDPYGESEGEMI